MARVTIPVIRVRPHPSTAAVPHCEISAIWCRLNPRCESNSTIIHPTAVNYARVRCSPCRHVITPAAPRHDALYGNAAAPRSSSYRRYVIGEIVEFASRVSGLGSRVQRDCQLTAKGVEAFRNGVPGQFLPAGGLSSRAYVWREAPDPHQRV